MNLQQPAPPGADWRLGKSQETSLAAAIRGIIALAGNGPWQ